ncbi:RNA 3'-phosphate cyclase [Nitrosopumilus sp. K4]|uniref:RNA 3'-terminal phosphate cyclase n=1 Tax=Nitrosopumilus sp. K4 TaxID=2795383 RepID=UPI001BA66A74|nr:RNA 3'-terminal phosphate cyclase [Nitrosopumilus sp. K4]QUC64672.1 RNA 3'-phosphate cyclase [Nitrosopumilus sp. K4]
MDFLKIDGNFGEGGGQIVRTAVTLSCITKTPIILENIRKNRKDPGLKHQHLTAIKILQKICNATIEGAKIGSTNLKFAPKDVKDAILREDVRTAGSIPLILQVLIPISAINQRKLELSIKGGTDVAWSPTIDYTNNVLREAYERLGINFSIELVKRGYYPKGGGEINLKVFPSTIKPISLTNKKTRKLKIFCSYSKLPEQLIKEKIEKIRSNLIEKNFDVKVVIKNQNAIDSGSTLLIASVDEESIMGIDSIFDKRTNEFRMDLKKITENELGVDENLADMLVVPASLAEGMTIFRVPKISTHLETNLYVTSKITGCKYGVGKLPNGFEVRIEGVSNASIQ